MRQHSVINKTVLANITQILIYDFLIFSTTVFLNWSDVTLFPVIRETPNDNDILKIFHNISANVNLQLTQKNYRISFGPIDRLLLSRLIQPSTSSGSMLR